MIRSESQFNMFSQRGGVSETISLPSPVIRLRGGVYQRQNAPSPCPRPQKPGPGRSCEGRDGKEAQGRGGRVLG